MSCSSYFAPAAIENLIITCSRTFLPIRSSDQVRKYSTTKSFNNSDSSPTHSTMNAKNWQKQIDSVLHHTIPHAASGYVASTFPDLSSPSSTSVSGYGRHPESWLVSSPPVRLLELVDGYVKVLSWRENERFISSTYLVDVNVATLFHLETLGQDTDNLFHILLPTFQIIWCSIVGGMECVALNRVTVFII